MGKYARCPRCGSKLERDGFCNYCKVCYDETEINNAISTDLGTGKYSVMQIRKRKARLRLYLFITTFVIFVAALVANFALADRLNLEGLEFTALLGLIPGIPGFLLSFLSVERLDSLREWSNRGGAILLFWIFLPLGWIVIVKNPSVKSLRINGVVFLIAGFIFILLPIIVSCII